MKRQPADPLVVSYGMGVDSTAMLVGLAEWGIVPEHILFADTGSEKPETYEYLPVINEWLDLVGFPRVTVVRYVPQRAKYSSLEGNCLVNETLPSLAFGRKSCSLTWKAEPMDRHVRRILADHIGAGGAVVRAIGYDAGPKDSRRGKHSPERSGPWRYVYPLRAWGWDRDDCMRAIDGAGLPVPVKSACFFCPATQPAELIQLATDHPDLARRAVAIEDGAQHRLREIKGLWGRGNKGIRAPKRPGRWREYLAAHGLLGAA